MKLKKKYLNGIKVFEPDILNDRNLSFCERVYSWQTMDSLGVQCFFKYDWDMRFEYANTLRGLYFQNPPYHQSMLIRIISGAAYIVAVSMNPNSIFYKRFFEYKLENLSREQIFVPSGYAMGFYSLEKNTILTIKTDNSIRNQGMIRISPFDETVGIKWPESEKIYISVLDKTAPTIDEAKTLYKYSENDSDEAVNQYDNSK